MNTRSGITSALGRNAPSSRPYVCNCRSHWQSNTSVFLFRRPMLRESTSFTSSPRASRTSNNGIQYTPVASIATVLIRHAINQSANAYRSSVNVPNLRTGSSSRSSGTETQCSCEPASTPAAWGLTSVNGPIIFLLDRRTRTRLDISHLRNIRCGPEAEDSGMHSSKRDRKLALHGLRHQLDFASSGTMLRSGLLPRTNASTASPTDLPYQSTVVHPLKTGAPPTFRSG
jgi:hypothetical protein